MPRSYFLSVLIFFGLSACSALAEVPAHCFDIMTQGFYRIAAPKDYNEGRSVYDLLERAIYKKDYRTFRAAFVELIHAGPALMDQSGSRPLYFKTAHLSFDSEYVYVQNSTWLPRKRLYKIKDIFDASINGRGDQFNYLQDRHFFVADLGSELKGINVDRRIKAHFQHNGPLTLKLNLKNETPTSLRLFLERYEKVTLRYRRAGRVVEISVPTSKVEYSKNGDVFVRGKYVFNLFEIPNEASSFYHLTLNSNKVPTHINEQFFEYLEYYQKELEKELN